MISTINFLNLISFRLNQLKQLSKYKESTIISLPVNNCGLFVHDRKIKSLIQITAPLISHMPSERLLTIRYKPSPAELHDQAPDNDQNHAD